MKSKSRVYPAEADPRQKYAVCTPENARTLTIDPAILAAEFGPWVRGADGRWQRRRKRG